MKLTQSKAGLAAFAVLLVSASAFASGQSQTASKRGPGGGEAGVPDGGGSCLFSYSIQKIGPTLAKEGDQGSYLIIVQNLGNCRLRHIDVTDALPRGEKVVSASPGGVVDPDRDFVRWEDQEILAGQYAVFEVSVAFDDHCGGQILTDTACAFTPWVGTKICDSVSTTVYRH
jgi:uncharacterized repeat protein (TIGR01451 family)